MTESAKTLIMALAQVVVAVVLVIALLYGWG